MTYTYPVYRPYLTGREKDLVLDCLDSTWISSKGEYIREFESRFASFLGVSHAVAVNNGTVALHVALEALGIGPGDEVLVPTLTYIASANAVSYTGATVVFVDSEPRYWQMDVRAAESKVTGRTKAIMPVHLYGHPCEMDAVMALARKYSLLVIEDCAEAIGTRHGHRLVGTFGDVGCFSFFGNKTITTGEGGMVVSNCSEHADRVSRLKGQGLAKNREYWHDLIGFNYRMTNICAAIGCAQLDSIEAIIEKKQMIAEWYREFLDGAPVRLQQVRPGTFHSFWMASILVDESHHRDPLRAYLKGRGVETRPLFYPAHSMEIYNRPGETYPVAEDLSGRGISLPSYPDLKKNDIVQICSYLFDYFEGLGKVSCSDMEEVSALAL